MAFHPGVDKNLLDGHAPQSCFFPVDLRPIRLAPVDTRPKMGLVPGPRIQQEEEEEADEEEEEAWAGDRAKEKEEVEEEDNKEEWEEEGQAEEDEGQAETHEEEGWEGEER